MARESPMRILGMSLSFLAAFVIVGALVGQEPKPGDPKGAKTGDTKVDPKAKVGDVKGADPKGVEPKAKGQLPQNWKQLGLTDKQTQDVYKVQAKYNEDIDKLEAQIKDFKAKMSKERSEILTPEQKKRLEEILKTKSGADK